MWINDQMSWFKYALRYNNTHTIHLSYVNSINNKNKVTKTMWIVFISIFQIVRPKPKWNEHEGCDREQNK